MLLADVDNGSLLAPGVQLDLVDSWCIAGVDHRLQVLDAEVADARRLDLALGLQLLEHFPQVGSAFWTRGRRMDQEAVNIACDERSTCQLQFGEMGVS